MKSMMEIKLESRFKKITRHKNNSDTNNIEEENLLYYKQSSARSNRPVSMSHLPSYSPTKDRAQCCTFIASLNLSAFTPGTPDIKTVK